MKRSYIFAVLFLISSCGKNENTIEAKRKLLEQKRQELSKIKSEIDALEAEIAATDTSDPLLKLKKVTVLPLQTQTFRHFIEVQGTVVSEKNINVMPETQGTVIRRFVQKGQLVKEGEPLVELDAEIIRKNIQEIETRLDLAKIVFQKQENLWKQRVGTEIQFLQAKNNVETLEKNLATLKTQLSKAIVRSPISGTVEELFVKEGEMASPMTPVAKVINLNTVEITADVSEVYAMRVKKGDEVTVKFPSYQIELPLKIKTVGQQIHPDNRTFRIAIEMDNRQWQIKPNATAVVKIKDFEAANAIVVPTHLIQKSTEGYKFLYTIQKEGEKSVVRKAIIQTGLHYEGKTHVTQGLQANDVLVIEGYNEVIDNEEVVAIEKNKNLAAN